MPDALPHEPAATEEYSESIAGAPLESILCTDELDRRPSRAADDEARDAALAELVRALDASPQSILQSLAESILSVLRCDSAGVSLVNEEGSRFYWPAIAGAWKPHISGGTPRKFGPCGDVLDLDSALLFKHFERRYRYFIPVMPPAAESLLVPFYVRHRAVGTIWAIMHDPPHDENSRRRGGRDSRGFEREDLRQLDSLGHFATKAYQVWTAVTPSERPGETGLIG